jgi:hypothetical protein
VRGLTDVVEGIGAVRARANPELVCSTVRSSQGPGAASREVCGARMYPLLRDDILTVSILSRLSTRNIYMHYKGPGMSWYVLSLFTFHCPRLQTCLVLSSQVRFIFRMVSTLVLSALRHTFDGRTFSAGVRYQPRASGHSCLHSPRGARELALTVFTVYLKCMHSMQTAED